MAELNDLYNQPWYPALAAGQCPAGEFQKAVDYLFQLICTAEGDIGIITTNEEQQAEIDALEAELAACKTDLQQQINDLEARIEALEP